MLYEPMSTQLIPISLIFLSALYAGVGLLIWGRRPGLAITPFAWMMFSIAVWSLGLGLELQAPSLNGKLLWAKVQFLGISSVSVFLFSFSAAYTGRKNLLTKRNQMYLWIIPSITIILAWTTPYHTLLWQTTTIHRLGSLSFLGADFGYWLWLHVSYSYMLTLVAIVFLLAEVIRSPRPYKLQAGIVLLGTLFPWVGNFLYLSGTVFPGIDLTPFSFVPTVLLFAWGILRYRLLGIIPMAPSMILHELQDGVVVIDIRKRVLYLNNLAEQLLQTTAEMAIGQPIESVQKDCLDSLQSLIEKKKTYAEQVFDLNGQQRYFDIRVSHLSEDEWGSNDTDASHLIILRDIHQRKQVELDLHRRQRTLNLLHEIVASALQTTDRQSMAKTIVNNLGNLIESDGCFLSLWDEISEKFTPLAAHGLHSKAYLSLTTEPGEPTLTASALATGQTLTVTDIFNTPYLSEHIAQALPFRSVLVLPLIAGEKKLGALLLAYSEVHHFLPEEISIGEQAAGLIALTLEKFYAVEDARKRAEESETLRKAGAAVAATLRSEEAVDRILEQLSLVIPYDSASVQLLRGDELEIVGGRGWENPRDVLGLRFPIPGDNPNTVVVQTGKPFILGDAVNAYSSFRKESHHTHIRSWLGVPMIVHGQITGLLAIDSTEKNYFTNEHLETVTTFANQVAIALENARLFEEVQNLALTDALTGLYNRRGLFEIGHIEFTRTRRLGRDFSVIMIDIDHFKHVNDQYGHPVGDQVLQFLASELRSIVRGADIVGRYGGEEFAIFLSGSNGKGAIELSERLRAMIEKTPFHVGENRISLTISLGVTEYNENSPDLETLVARADQALYVAKHKGRNRVVLGK